MKINALIATLVLGSSSIALADHAPTVRDHRTPIARPLPAPIAQPAPVTQVTPMPYQGSFGLRWQRPARPLLLANDTHLAGRALIQVPSSARAFTNLELRSNNGRTSIDRVLITFGNGQRQFLSLNKVVNGKNTVTIDLPGGSRNIKSVMLIGNSNRRATIDVVAV